MGITEQGFVPDRVIRLGIRRLIKQRLAEINADDTEKMARAQHLFTNAMRSAEIAPVPEKANEQHYEVPAALFESALGAHMKYSSCYWHDNTTELDKAEEDALRETCLHAEISNDMDILELGCGWGSLTLWMAAQYPLSRITAVSNSNSQREFINQQAQSRGLKNIDVITCDMNDFTTSDTYDRVVSVEMFEHMRNYPVLFQQIHDWLRPGGKFFMHIFVHRAVPYLFEENDESDWMGRYFFSGGIMPSDDLPLFYQEHLKFLQRWRWDGTHYQKTAYAWLQNMDANKDQLWPVFENTYGKENARQWWMRWRMFFMACEELFGYNKGQEWWVSHYLFQRP
jgi:cyclopropane-fatty-acyl-phospholipid synthase